MKPDYTRLVESPKKMVRLLRIEVIVAHDQEDFVEDFKEGMECFNNYATAVVVEDTIIVESLAEASEIAHRRALK